MHTFVMFHNSYNASFTAITICSFMIIITICSFENGVCSLMDLPDIS